MPVNCFQIDKADNVATLLQDVSEAGELLIHGDAPQKGIRAVQLIRAGHKIAVRPILQDEHIVKYGSVIGVATQPIAQGEWVHLHNCRSLYDVHSSINLESGSRQETRYV